MLENGLLIVCAINVIVSLIYAQKDDYVKATYFSVAAVFCWLLSR